jgi:hypothetical protein
LQPPQPNLSVINTPSHSALPLLVYCLSLLDWGPHGAGRHS